MSPTLFKFQSYFLVLSISLSLCILWTYLRSKKIGKEKLALDLSLILMLFGMIGARLAHVLVEYPDYYIKNPFDILLVYQGGFVFYGGFVLAFLTGALFLKLKNQKISDFLDILAPIVPFGYGIGRFGCLLAGCCFGKETAFYSNLNSGVHLNSHPTQIYSSIFAFMITLTILYMEKLKIFEKKRFFVYLLLYGIFRALTEHLRGDYRGDIYFSSILSVFFLAISLGYLLFSNKKSYI